MYPYLPSDLLSFLYQPQVQQTYFEKMKMAHEADAQQKDSPFQVLNMRLGAAYSLFDGEELLEKSILSISSQVKSSSRNSYVHPLTRIIGLPLSFVPC